MVERRKGPVVPLLSSRLTPPSFCVALYSYQPANPHHRTHPPHDLTGGHRYSPRWDAKRMAQELGAHACEEARYLFGGGAGGQEEQEEEEEEA